MSQKTFSLVAGIIFSLIALGHLLRLAFSVEWVVEGWTVPPWISAVAVGVAVFLAYEGLRLSRKG